MLSYAIIAITKDGDVLTARGNEDGAIPGTSRAHDTIQTWLRGPVKYRRFVVMSSTAESDGLTIYDGNGRECFGADLMDPA